MSEPEAKGDDELIQCWCGAKGTYAEMFEPLPSRCGGSGVIECECGGDFCVCHNHGEADCFGCQDCEGEDNDDDVYWYDDDRASGGLMTPCNCGGQPPNLTEEMVLNPDALPAHMRGMRRFRIEYGFECGCPEGLVYLPRHVDPDRLEALLREGDDAI